MDPTVPASSEQQSFEFTTHDGLTVTGAVRLNPVHTCLVHLLPEMKQPLIAVTVANADTQTRRLQVDVHVTRFSDVESHLVTVAPGRSATQHFAPTFDHKHLAGLTEVTPATLHVAVHDPDTGRSLGRDTLRVQLLPVHSAPLSSLDPQTGARVDQTRFLGVFIAEGDASLNPIIHAAGRLLPRGRQMIGNRGGDADVLVEAIYKAVAALGIVYAHVAIDINPAAETQASQRIQFPNEVLQAQNKVANCLDGVLLFAGLLRRIKLETAIVLVNHHALVAWRAPGSTDDDWRYLDTTKLGEATFAQAQQRISPEWFLPHDKQADAPLTDPRRWEVAKLRAAGILPLPETPLGKALQRDGTDARVDAQDTTPALLPYWRHWFDKTWTKVNLADVSRRDDRASLLDIYVPLPVDFNIVVKTNDGMVVDWWAKDERAEIGESRRARHVTGALDTDGGVPDDLDTKQRTWPSLQVDEADLEAIVGGIQNKITERAAQGKETKDGEHSCTMEAHDAASVQSRFVLVGDPGSGKSSFLRHLTLCLAGELRRRAGDADVPDNASLAALRDWLRDAYTPVFIELHDLVDTVFPSLPTDATQAVPLPGLEHFWRYMVNNLLPAPLQSLQSALDDALRHGHAIVLLDGLDEVGDAVNPGRRRQIKAFVGALVDAYPQARFIITSRPQAYRRGDWALDGFGRAELRLLSTERLYELAVALFTIVNPENAQQEADDFIRAMDARNVPNDMRGTPLFFTLLTALWLRAEDENDDAPVRDLPTTRGELYRQSVDLLLTKWTRRRPPAQSLAEQLNCSPAQLRTVLELLACTIFAHSERLGESVIFNRGDLLDALYQVQDGAVQKSVLDYLERQAGILIAPENGRFRFVHWSFQEHLAACDLLHRRPEDRTPPAPADRLFPQGLTTRVRTRPELWHNVARLAADELQRQHRYDDLSELLALWLQPYVVSGVDDGLATFALELANDENLMRPLTQPYDPRTGLLNLLRDAALKLLVDLELAPEQRDKADKALAKLGDPRKGVGLRADGLPDFDWAPIPGGPFTFQEDQRPTLDTFWIARYPVTFSQFQVFLDAVDGFRNPEWWAGLAASSQHKAKPGEQRFPFANHPRENVSWYDAVAFCRWLTAKLAAHPDLAPPLPPDANGMQWRITLPTEMQWEKAARGDTGWDYPWGPEYTSGYANIDETWTSAKVGEHNLRTTSAVGMYPQGKSPFDVRDMSGNVWEWCLNAYAQPAAQPDQVQLSGDDARSLRGGSWGSSHVNAAAVRRNRSPPRFRHYHWGCRVVAVLVPIGSEL